MKAEGGMRRQIDRLKADLAEATEQRRELRHLLEERDEQLAIAEEKRAAAERENLELRRRVQSLDWRLHAELQRLQGAQRATKFSAEAMTILKAAAELYEGWQRGLSAHEHKLLQQHLDDQRQW